MMTDPFAGRRIFETNWPKHPTVARPPAVIKVPERNETDIRDVADMISPLTESERADLRNAIFADAVKRVGATLAELSGTPWNKWCYMTGLRYGPAFAAGVFAEDEREQLVETFVNRAQSESWNVREADAGIRNGLRRGHGHNNQLHHPRAVENSSARRNGSDCAASYPAGGRGGQRQVRRATGSGATNGSYGQGESALEPRYPPHATRCELGFRSGVDGPRIRFICLGQAVHGGLCERTRHDRELPDC